MYGARFSANHQYDDVTVPLIVTAAEGAIAGYLIRERQQYSDRKGATCMAEARAGAGEPPVNVAIYAVAMEHAHAGVTVLSPCSICRACTNAAPPRRSQTINDQTNRLF